MHLNLHPLRICWSIKKSGASYVCLCNTSKTKELRGNSANAARVEVIPDDVSEELSSVSVIATDGTSPTDETPPFHEKSVPALRTIVWHVSS